MRARDAGVVVAVLIGLTAAVGGCRSEAVAITRERLETAGFERKVAESPEEVQRLWGLPQHEVFSRERDGDLSYLYADALYCRCLYLGDEAAYRRYAGIVVAYRAIIQRVLRPDFSGFSRSVWMPWKPL